MNKVVLIGRLTKDPELKFTPGTGTAVATFTLAVDRRIANKNGQREADFVPIVIWGKQAEAIANYSAKGKLIAVAGRIQIRSYEAKDGTKRFVTEVIAEETQIIEWAKASNISSGQANNSNNFNEDMYEVLDDGDIPF